MKPEPTDFESDRKRVLAGILEIYGITVPEAEFDALNQAARESDGIGGVTTTRGRIEYRLVHLQTPDGKAAAVAIGWSTAAGRACIAFPLPEEVTP